MDFLELRAEADRYAKQALSPSNREWYQRVVDALDSAERMREALRAFTIHATYPVSTEINPRGYAWRGEEALDYAKGLADGALNGQHAEGGEK